MINRIYITGRTSVRNYERVLRSLSLHSFTHAAAIQESLSLNPNVQTNPSPTMPAETNLNPTISIGPLCLYYAYYTCAMPNMPVLCLPCLYCAYYTCTVITMRTMPVLCLLCLYYAYSIWTVPTMPVLSQLCLHYAYYVWLAQPLPEFNATSSDWKCHTNWSHHVNDKSNKAVEIKF